MKAFLSHSSWDKHIANAVADALGGANVELDRLTFDDAILNTDAIQNALKRSALFVLLLSRSAIESPYVKYELMSAEELKAKGLLERILIIVVDNDDTFAKIDARWKKYNVVRRAMSAKAIARLIQSQLLAARAASSASVQPFVGRAKQIEETKEKLIDPLRRTTKALFVSGNAGAGRRTFAKKIFSEVYPFVTPVFPEVVLDDMMVLTKYIVSYCLLTRLNTRSSHYLLRLTYLETQIPGSVRQWSRPCWTG